MVDIRLRPHVIATHAGQRFHSKPVVEHIVHKLCHRQRVLLVQSVNVSHFSQLFVRQVLRVRLQRVVFRQSRGPTELVILPVHSIHVVVIVIMSSALPSGFPHGNVSIVLARLNRRFRRATGSGSNVPLLDVLHGRLFLPVYFSYAFRRVLVAVSLSNYS
jgi:hypothetical protein